MARLIDADALKRVLVVEWNLHDSDEFANKDVWKALELAPTVHPEQPKIGKWTPCKERLPDKDGDYLVTFEKGYAEDYGFSDIGIAPFEVDCEGFGIWQEHFHPVSLGSLGSEWVEIPVTAWMPLPEPYKEEEDGND